MSKLAKILLFFLPLLLWLMLAGNRPCSLLGLTVGDWQQRRAGFCPFNQSNDNELVEEDPKYDRRKILKNPFVKPVGSDVEVPTGVIVQSNSDKITIGPPCYIWFPSELEDLVSAHCLMTSKMFEQDQDVDVHHPNSLLFLNSKANRIRVIEVKHLQQYTGLPIVAYDFRRSLSTFCFESQDEDVRRCEPSILRHSQNTGYFHATL